ncbi:unnamed protein product [Ostreobium quekettii]|uniref:Helicase C-terminal domain-containing protein n=1 Tax=Ostreobium quekettii TaxID=121088 RepID=A0A8S1JE60_9CHLO|nr:unnamed protein product [Ostreobium quekettii]|eukprot:evm.model.scf_2928.2 EVM.evm.TU.scf_2928.2   scf_2928:6147-7895(-)
MLCQQASLMCAVQILKQTEREAAAERVQQQLGLDESEYFALPRHIRKAAVSGGVQAMVEAGYTRDDALLRFHDSHGGVPWHQQHVFVAATLPSRGGKSVAADIRELFPQAVWITSQNLHRPIDLVTHQWVQVSAEDCRAVLQSAVQDDPDHKNGRGRTLVFAKDVAASKGVANVLESAGIGCVLYHSKMPAFEREKRLEEFSGRQGGVMVCSDAASRGLDIPEITHVVQADFAASAMDFLHRIGRTGRAGKAGRATSLYTEENAALVDVIKGAIARGQPIDGAFSRRRSFRRKLKRYGRYVPRGELAADHEELSSKSS